MDKDTISPKDILNGLGTKVFGKKIIFYDKIDSTNAEAKKFAKTSCEHGTLFIAEEQDAGRGRLERHFFTPKSMGLWFSILLRPKLQITDAGKCTLLAAVAVALAMKEIGLTPEIKWPNDIMYKNKKLTGILTELVTLPDKTYAIIIGIGINVNFSEEDFPENIRNIATSLAIMKGEKINRTKFLQRVLFFMEELYNKAESRGFSEIFNLWRSFSTTINKNIRVINAGDGKEIIGYAIDIDEDGALIVEVGGKLQKILAGDVSIREMGNKN